MSLKSKTLLITGGTSQLGACFVEEACRQGASVHFTYHQGKEKAAALENLGAKAYALDLSDSMQIDEFVKSFKADVSSLQALIHNAAAVRDHTIQNLSEADWDYVLNVDLKAPYLLTKKLLRLLFKGQSPKKGTVPNDGDRAVGAKVLFLTSRVALQGGFGVSNYAAAKAGIIGLTKSLAQELGKKRVLVNAVNPGFMKSAMTENLPQEVMEKNLQASPLGEYSDPKEVASFLCYLCSDQMTQLTGQVIHFEARKT